MMQIKSFDKFLDENFTSGMATHTKPMVLMSRNQLPNIDDFKEFYQDISSQGDNLVHMSLHSNLLSPTQNEFNDDKVASIKKTIGSKNTGEVTPILISNDNFIIDGHHRWKAFHELDLTMPVTVVGKTYDEVIKFLKDKPYVKKKELSESETK